MNAADDSKRDGRMKIGRQQKGVAHRERPVAHLQRLTVAQLDERKIVAAEKFDHRHVPRWVDADDHRVVQDTVGQTALHEIAGAVRDVKVREGVAVAGNQNTRAASLPARRKNRHDRRRDLRNDRHPLLFRLGDRRVDRQGRPRANKHGDDQEANTNMKHKQIPIVNSITLNLTTKELNHRDTESTENKN